jgi:hypothetical protein
MVGQQEGGALAVQPVGRVLLRSHDFLRGVLDSSYLAPGRLSSGIEAGTACRLTAYPGTVVANAAALARHVTSATFGAWLSQVARFAAVF